MTASKEAILTHIRAMRYGYAQRFGRFVIADNWPATGGDMAVLAALTLGVPPPPTRSSQELFEEDLGDDFKVEREREYGDFIVIRKLAKCPHCGGSNMRRVYRPPPIPRLIGRDDGPIPQVPSSSSWVKCSHEASNAE